MDNRVIGIFDSGLGGLTAVRQLRRIMPREHFVFFGDTARNPYGPRSKPELTKFGRQNIAFLKTFNPKAIIVACGTISANSLDIISTTADIPVLGVIEPAVKYAASKGDNKTVGVIATEASIKSGTYERRLSESNKSLKIMTQACPAFVPLIESGHSNPGDTETEGYINEYLNKMKDNIDMLILGCTHYPLLSRSIENYLGDKVELIDVAAQCVNELHTYLKENDLEADAFSHAKDRYFVSGNSDSFAACASDFLGEDITGKVEKVDITKY